MRLLTLLTLSAALLVGPAVMAADHATPEEAKTMAVKAADYLKSNGPDKAFAAFNAKEGPWHDRDLYVAVMDSHGVVVVHGNNPGLIGRSILDLRDVDGKLFSREILAVTDTAWVDYKWQDPVTKAVERKTQYEVRVGEYVVGVGAYSQ
jgi:signal transduction histidine kinase